MTEPALAPLPSIEDLNELPAADFAARLAPLFEGAPSFLARLAATRPFESFASLWARALDVARSMPEADQLELINAHPRLGAPPAKVSAMSFHEQGYDTAGAQAAEAEAARVGAELERLNAEYEARFGFRYCVFVNGRSRAALLPGMAAALAAGRAAEIDRALTVVVAIAADRSRTLSR